MWYVQDMWTQAPDSLALSRPAMHSWASASTQQQYDLWQSGGAAAAHVEPAEHANARDAAAVSGESAMPAQAVNPGWRIVVTPATNGQPSRRISSQAASAQPTQQPRSQSAPAPEKTSAQLPPGVFVSVPIPRDAIRPPRPRDNAKINDGLLEPGESSRFLSRASVPLCMLSCASRCCAAESLCGGACDHACRG